MLIHWLLKFGNRQKRRSTGIIIIMLCRLSNGSQVTTMLWRFVAGELNGLRAAQGFGHLMGWWLKWRCHERGWRFIESRSVGPTGTLWRTSIKAHERQNFKSKFRKADRKSSRPRQSGNCWPWNHVLTGHNSAIELNDKNIYNESLGSGNTHKLADNP